MPLDCFSKAWNDMLCKNDRPTMSLVAGACMASFLIGLRAVGLSGFRRNLPPATAILSAAIAASGSLSCILTFREDRGDTGSVELPPNVVLALACFCAALSPLPMIRLSHSALADVVGPIRLALPGAVGASVMFELLHRTWARVDPARVSNMEMQELLQASTPGGSASWSGGLFGWEDGLIARAGRHWKRHFTERRVGGAFFLIQLIVTCCGVQIEYAMTTWQNAFTTVLQNKDAIGFYGQLYDFVPIAAASILASVYGGYLTTIWDLRWREELTRDFYGKLLDQKTYYYVSRENASETDNFDQRIVEDAAIFATNSRALLCGFSAAVIRLAVFGPALLRLSPSPVVWQLCLLMSLVSSVMTHVVGQPLASRNEALQRAEADLRTAMMRLRLFSEEIALQQGDAAESAGTMSRFEALKAATWRAARGALQLSTFTSAYGLVGGVLPTLILAPSYLYGSMSLGLLFQLQSVVGGVQQSTDWFVGAYADITVWRAAAGRLLALESSVTHSCPADAQALAEGGDHLSADNVMIRSQGGEVLMEGVTFRWCCGERICIRGPSGSGKTALIRLLAGAWPPAAAGCVHPGKPGAGVLMLNSAGFLLPSRASLRRCLAYPEAMGAYDEDLLEALCSCGLEALADRLDEEADWGAVLSLAEKQRLAFARLIAKWPVGARWLLLDEVDSALDPQSALTLMQCLLDSAAKATVGLVVASKHEVCQRESWRRFRIDAVAKCLKEDTVTPGTGEAPPSGGRADDHR